MITMIETVSSHFNYSEEYVLKHSFPWLKRKFKQADREDYEERKERSDESMRGVMAALSAMFGGKESDIEGILHPPYEKLVKQENIQPEETWNIAQWWKKPQK